MIIPTGYAQANFRYTGSSSPHGAEWTLGLDVGGVAGDPDDVAQLLYSNYDTSGIQGVLTIGWSLVEVYVKFGPQETGPSGSKFGGLPGDSTSDAVEPNTALLVHKNTAFGGRAGRGRAYLPGFSDTSVLDNGSIIPATLDAVNGFLTTFRNKIITDDLIPVVLHGPGSPLTTPTPIVSLTADSRVATQRRRLRR